MKKILFLATTLIGFGLVPAFAQFGSHSGSGPNFGGAMDKLFGANQTFSAAMELQTVDEATNTTTIPGKLNFDTGKARFEMNLADMTSSKMSAATLAQMKSMGMDSMISISRPDLKLNYIVYPGLKSYLEMASQDSAATNADDYRVATTELGKETVDGHDCVKNKVVVTGKDSTTNESIVWNATDLKKFPVKIVTIDSGTTNTMLYKNISFAKPSASLFEPPTGLTKYTSIQTMMQAEMMKKMGGGMAMPPAGQ